MEGTVTALKVQKRNPQRVNVYLDGEFAFGLARITAAWLHVGRVLTAAEVAALQAKDTVEVAHQQALTLLSYRPRSAAEIGDRLEEKGFTAEVVAAVIERLNQTGLVNDSQFAHDWVENRSTFRPRSRRVLSMELRRKGVAQDQIDLALAGAGDESELAYQAGRRTAQRAAALDWQAFRTKVGGFLARRGFTYETIAPVTRRLWDEVRPAQDQITIPEEEQE
jgi:regulatory protein